MIPSDPPDRTLGSAMAYAHWFGGSVSHTHQAHPSQGARFSAPSIAYQSRRAPFTDLRAHFMRSFISIFGCGSGNLQTLEHAVQDGSLESRRAVARSPLPLRPLLRAEPPYAPAQRRSDLPRSHTKPAVNSPAPNVMRSSGAACASDWLQEWLELHDFIAVPPSRVASAQPPMPERLRTEATQPFKSARQTDAFAGQERSKREDVDAKPRRSSGLRPLLPKSPEHALKCAAGTATPIQARAERSSGPPAEQDAHLKKEDFDARLAKLHRSSGLPLFFPESPEHALKCAAGAAKPTQARAEPSSGPAAEPDAHLEKEDFDARLAELRRSITMGRTRRASR